MIDNNIFCYWEGHKYPYIEYCLETIKNRSQGCDLHLITPGNVYEYLKEGEDIHPKWKRITWLAQKTDILRISLIHKFGGCWLDADTILLKSPIELFNSNKDIICMKWKNKRILNGYFLAPKQSKFLGYCKEYINRILTNNPKHNYHEHSGVLFGECMFGEIHHDHWKDLQNLIDFIALEYFLPIEFPFNKDIWYKFGDIKKYLKSYTIAIGLNHSQYPNDFRDKTVTQHMRENLLFGNIFKYSESIDNTCNFILNSHVCPRCGMRF